jgi:WD40 repeat protein
MESPARPGALDASLRGDLEAILLTAIEKDRDRRYQSAAALATDIRRYLRNEAIEARPPNFLTQCRLFARRNRPTVAAMGAVAAALIVATVLSATFAVRSVRDSRRRSEAERAALVERDAARWKGYIANIAAGLSAQQLSEFQRMRASLSNASEEFRGWEWRFLAGMAERSDRIIQAHDDMIYAFGASRDRERIITGAADGSVAVWNTRLQDRVAMTRASDAGRVNGAALSPDGRVGYFGGSAGVLYEWAFDEGESARAIGEHAGEIFSVSAGQDGVVVVTTTRLECAVWERGESGWSRRSLEIEGGAVSAAFSLDRSRFAVWTPEGRVRIHDAPFGALLAEFDFEGGIMGCAFSPDNARFAAAGDDGIVREWSIATGEELMGVDATPGDGTVVTLAYTQGGETLAAGLMHRTIMIYTRGGPSGMWRVGGHEEAVTGLLFIDEGNTLLSASRDKTIRVWDFGSMVGPGRVLTLFGHSEPVLDVAFAPDLTTMATASRDDTVRLWEPDLGTSIGALRGHTGDVVSVVYTEDGSRLASASEDGTVRIWDARTGECVGVLRGHEGGVWGVAFDSSGRKIASAGRDTTVRVWDASTGETLRVMRGHDARVNGLSFSPDGALIATASRDHTVRVWDASSGALVRTITDHESDVFDAKFSANGDLLYTGSRDQTVRVWSTSTWECVDVLGGHGQLVTSLSLSDDGARLAAGSWFGEVLLWDIGTRDLVASFRAHESSIRGISFSPGGRWLATCSSDHTVRLFDGTPAAERTRLASESRRSREEAGWWLSRMPVGATRGNLDAVANDESLDEETKRWVRRFVLLESVGSIGSRASTRR